MKKEVQEFDNIKEILYSSAKKYNDHIAFTIKHQNGKEVEYENKTYTELLNDVNTLGKALYNLGAKGKRVAIIGKNRYEWVITHLANLLGGIVSVPLDKDLQIEELENSLVRSKAEYIVFDSKLTEKMQVIKSANRTNLREFICMDKVEGFLSIEELLENGKNIENDEYIKNKIDNNAMEILLFTSGTTSQSKAVMLSHKNIASNIYAMQTCEDIRDTDTNIAFLPFHHIFGSTCIIMMIASGVKTVFPDGLRYIKKNLNEYKVTIFVGVPILVEAIYKTIMKEVEKLFKQVINALGGKLRFVISGGAPADAEISKGFNNLGIKTVQGYGLTETSPVIAAEDDKHMKNGSIGIPMCNVKLEVVNKDEEGIGEIRVKGPNVMLGYYEMPEKTKEVLKDGWFYTGDLGYVDEEGYLYITGRSKSLIVLKNGKKIFPEELETIVNRLELVSESMVFGLPDKQDKNDVKLSVKIVYDKEVVKEKYPQKTEEELYQIIWQQIKEVNKGFPRYKHIQNMILTDKELIKTTTKKVKRQEEMKSISNFA